MPRIASKEPRVITVRVPQKNGDTYIIERKIVYDEKKKYNRVQSSQLIAKIRKDEFNPVPTRPKRGKSAVLDAKVQILNASRMRVGMMDVVAHIGDASGIDSAIYAVLTWARPRRSSRWPATCSPLAARRFRAY